MVNDFDSNITQKLIRIFLEKFETARVLTKLVDTQLLSGEFDPASGEEVNFKRPTDYRSVRTPDGDLTGLDNDIITGKAKGVVQEFFSVSVNFKQVDQALKMDQLDQLLAPMATRIVTDLEVDFARFMLLNSGLQVGTIGTAVTGWKEVALAGALMKSVGIPSDGGWNYASNPFTQVNLAEVQRTLQSGGTSGELVSEALRMATIADNFAGMKVITATALANVTPNANAADRAGTVNVAPDPTYLGAKDSMTQTFNVDALTDGDIFLPGESITVTNVNRLNLSTRQPIINDAGARIPWTGTIVAVSPSTGVVASNALTITVTGPAIFESPGQYNTVDRAITDGDVVTFLGAAGVTYQPNLFWHRQAFGIGSVPLQKLFATDTIGETEDGLQIRVTKFSDGVKNVQKVRFDLLPAYAALNPFFAGQAFGTA